MLMRAIAVAALAVVMTTGLAQAKCDVECRQHEAYLGGVWKNRQPAEVGEDTYYVAIVPGRKSALVYWTSGIKTTSQAKIEDAANQVSGCKANGSSALSKYADEPNTPIKTRKFRKKSFIEVSLKC
jgi:hypothetical protein